MYLAVKVICIRNVLKVVWVGLVRVLRELSFTRVGLAGPASRNQAARVTDYLGLF